MNCVSCDICVYHFGLCVFFPGVFLSSRVTGACPVTTDLIMRVNVRTTTTILNTYKKLTVRRQMFILLSKYGIRARSTQDGATTTLLRQFSETNLSNLRGARMTNMVASERARRHFFPKIQRLAFPLSAMDRISVWKIILSLLLLLNFYLNINWGRVVMRDIRLSRPLMIRSIFGVLHQVRVQGKSSLRHKLYAHAHVPSTWEQSKVFSTKDTSGT